ncbi:MAG: hypothetical protein ATN35_05685 [Epulopiscium sp. Nele67-Bin004]|nr:MAG: hypothetical protein ATN35_05685 [Epulopiscium sp. Nele67-Bin004]
MDNVALVEGIKNSDVSCYEALVSKYTRYVVAIIKKVANNQLSRQDIEELTADVFIKIWTIRDRDNIMPDRLNAYIAKMTRNMTLNKLRIKSIQVIEDEQEGVNEHTPEDDILMQEVNSQVFSAVIKLKQPEKEIFIRRYFYMESIASIAKYLNIPENTVHTKLSRGKKKLKKLLMQEGYSI